MTKGDFLFQLSLSTFSLKGAASRDQSLCALPKGVLLFCFVSFWQSALLSDPRGTTDAVLRATNRCALYRKGYFFFAMVLLTPLAVRNPSGVTYSHTALDLLLQVSSKGVLLFFALFPFGKAHF